MYLASDLVYKRGYINFSIITLHVPSHASQGVQSRKTARSVLIGRNKQVRISRLPRPPRNTRPARHAYLSDDVITCKALKAKFMTVNALRTHRFMA